MECDVIMDAIKKHKWSIALGLVLIGMFIYDVRLGSKALNLSFSNIKTMLSILPPIFIIIGLLDVWVPKETMIKYMGHNSGLKGVGIALLLGSVAAGPLYAAFPIAAILIKKGARLAYVLFFLGVWSSAKIPLIIFEYTSFGGKFTFYHIVSSLIIYLAGSVLMEKALSQESIDSIYTKSETI